MADAADTNALPADSADTRFGRLHPVSSSSLEGWSHEAHDFTPWLAEHLDLLGEELDLSLKLKEREFPVGRFSLDLLLEDARGRTIIVENQFGQTDHDHLGKLLTYCAGAEAKVVIWISETITEEHAAALEWLNESTVADVGFFGVQLELLKVDDSKPAPHFRVVVQPNEWVKRVRPESPAAPADWDWDAYAERLNISQERIRVGRELVERIERVLRDRGLPWRTVFRKGYVAFQRTGGYNAVIVDLWWRKVPRFAVKVPGAPEELGLLNPYPDLDPDWVASEDEWGWTIPAVDKVPDVAAAIDLARPLHPEAGPMRRQHSSA